MRLTPLDIRHKEFSRAMRGYKDLEVDEFLDDIADEFERLFNENIDYKDRLESLEEKIEQYRNIEDTLKKTLLSAQQQADELKQNAQKEGDLILRDAELKSRSIINDSYAERQKIQRSVAALKQKQEDLRYQLKSVIETYTNILEQDEEIGLDAAAEAEFESLSETAEAASAEEVPPSIDEAVSREIMGEETISAASASASEFSPAPATGSASSDELSMPATDFSLSERVPGEPSLEKDAVRSNPPLEPKAKKAEEEDPFADVEIDTDEHKFKW
ncbi:MAG: DivIVA domain-containing protein [Thermoleophilia bacterium]